MKDSFDPLMEGLEPEFTRVWVFKMTAGLLRA